MSDKKIPIQDFFLGKGEPLVFMSGPCVIESEKHCLESADFLKELFQAKNVPFVFKCSYDKANRSSIHSYRGPGLKEGLRILKKVEDILKIPIVTDDHTPEEAQVAGEVVDVLQIPAFLCRQTDLLVAAAKTGCVISVKKGQFLAPWDMKNVIEKIYESGNQKVVAVDRGVTFGYNNLVSDFRSIPIMQKLGVPVCYDATHSVQLPGGMGDQSGGQREFIPILAKAAVAAGANSIFMEAHPNPNEAKSDAASVIAFEDLSKLVDQLLKISEALSE